MDDNPAAVVLQTDDPNSLTVPKLKSLLAACGVALPTTKALKAEYVRLFYDLKERLLQESKTRVSPVSTFTSSSSVSSVSPSTPSISYSSPSSPSVSPSSPTIHSSPSAPSFPRTTPSSPVASPPVITQPNTALPKQDSFVTNLLAYSFYSTVCLFWILVASCLVWFAVQYPKYCEPGKTEGCIPCPPHGNCINGQLLCEETFVLVKGKCVKDTKLEKAANEVINLVSMYLQRKHGRNMCGEEATAWATEQELVNHLMQSSRLVSSVNDSVWVRTKALISNSETNITPHNGKYYTNDFILPFLCNLQNQLWNLKFYFAGLLAIILGILYLMRWNRLRQYEHQLVEKLLQDCYGILMQHKSNYLSGHSAEPFVVKSHIRDFLLKPPLSKVDKQRWEKVVNIIKSDSRVQCTIWSSHGEQQDVWEWTAPIF